jgi:PAS domain S-box-containing protein
LVLALLTDITERKRAGETLRQNEATLRGILDATKESIWLYSPEGIVIMGNQTALSRFGKTASEIIGKHFTQILPGDLAQSRLAHLKEAVDSRRPINFEDERAGTLFHHTYYPVLGSDESVIRIACFSRDITESKRVERALRESEERYRSLFESMDEGFAFCEMLYDQEGKPLDFRYLNVNPAFGKLTGLPIERVIGRTVKEVIPGIEPFWIEVFDRITQSGRSERIQNPVAELGRHYEAYSWRSAPGCFAVVFNDATERKHAEEALYRTVEELRRSNQELEQFAYITSHDLQEPLRQVRSFTQLLRERYGDKLEGKAAEYMQFVTEGTSRMLALVHDLLVYSRVGAREARRQPVLCQVALNRALANLETSIAESNARITYDELPCVVAEPTQMAQLFQNLVGNAIKFHRDSVPPEIQIGARRDGGNWLFWVKDNGVGIDPQYHNKVFLIFQRLHGRRKYAGTGIGLAICKRIVEQHGGRIWLDSEEGQGATFYFTLPREGVE